MSSAKLQGIDSEIKKSNPLPRDRCLLFRLPSELRDEIYTYIFASIYARRWKHKSSHELAILQTCTQIHAEASSVHYNRTPLRFFIGHLQNRSSTLPPKLVTDRFKNVSFELKKITSTHPSYEFVPVFDALTKPYIQSPLPRKSCHFQCELVEHAGSRSCGPALLSKAELFTYFETLSLTFKGELLKSEYPQEEPVGDDLHAAAGRLELLYKRGTLAREKACFNDVESMFRKLEEHLGPGEMLDLADRSDVLHAWKLVFHPLQRALQVQKI